MLDVQVKDFVKIICFSFPVIVPSPSSVQYKDKSQFKASDMRNRPPMRTTIVLNLVRTVGKQMCYCFVTSREENVRSTA